MLTGTTTQTYECGACHGSFPALDDVFSHPCPAIAELMGRRAHLGVDRVETNRADNIDAPERRERTGERATGGRPAMTNRYPGNCQRCGRRVEAGEGHAVKNHAGGRGASWAVEHKVSECPAIGARETVPAARPVVDTPDVTAEPAATPGGPPMSDRQEAFLRSLLAERNPEADADGVVEVINGMPNPRAGASAMIDTLKAAPRVERPAVAGYEPEKGDVHVVDGDYYRVHTAQRSGRPYVCRWDGAAWDYEGGRGMLRKLSAATLATAEDAARFGEMFGCCVYCTRPLDTPESTAVGYGPVCAAKRGLPWGGS